MTFIPERYDAHESITALDGLQKRLMPLSDIRSRALFIAKSEGLLIGLRNKEALVALIFVAQEFYTSGPYADRENEDKCMYCSAKEHLRDTGNHVFYCLWRCAGDICRELGTLEEHEYPVLEKNP